MSENKKGKEMSQKQSGNVFDVTISNRILKEVMQITNAIAPEVRLSGKRDGIYIQQLDSARICGIKIFIPRKEILEYNSYSVIGIDTGRLLKYINNVHIDRNIRILLTSIGYLELSTHIDGVSHILRTPYLDINRIHEPKWPELEGYESCIISTSALKTAINMYHALSEYITSKICIKMYKEGNIIFEMRDNNNKNNVAYVHIAAPSGFSKSVVSNYPLDYLKKMISIIRSPTVTLCVDDQYPLQIKWKITGTDIEVTYVLAPQIEEA